MQKSKNSSKETAEPVAKILKYICRMGITARSNFAKTKILREYAIFSGKYAKFCVVEKFSF
jgi:hypothetical protein